MPHLISALPPIPHASEAYYQKGLNLLGKATLQGDKTIAPPGTAEAFQKYLELAPTGPNAHSAKDLLASIGSTVETSYGKKTTTAEEVVTLDSVVQRAARSSRLCAFSDLRDVTKV